MVLGPGLRTIEEKNLLSWTFCFKIPPMFQQTGKRGSLRHLGSLNFHLKGGIKN
jgi:hypothetical protein